MTGKAKPGFVCQIISTLHKKKYKSTFYQTTNRLAKNGGTHFNLDPLQGGALKSSLVLYVESVKNKCRSIWKRNK